CFRTDSEAIPAATSATRLGLYRGGTSGSGVTCSPESPAPIRAAKATANCTRLDGVRTAIKAGFAVVVPAGTKHNIINTGSVPLKLYTLYAPPNHRDGVVHHTRAEAEADSEHFDGKTTE